MDTVEFGKRCHQAFESRECLRTWLGRFERHLVLVHLRDARHWQAAAALASLELYNDYLGPISETTGRLHNTVFYLSGGGPEENSCAVWVCVHSRNSQDSEL